MQTREGTITSLGRAAPGSAVGLTHIQTCLSHKLLAVDSELLIEIEAPYQKDNTVRYHLPQ